MAALPGAFNAAEVKPATGGADVWPIGRSLAHIVANEMKATSNGNGQYLELTIEGLDGPAAGLRIFDNLNLVNPNEQAMMIARSTLSAICHAVGVLQITDADALMFKPLVIDVKAGADYPDKVTGEMRHGGQRVKGYAPHLPGVALPPAKMAQPRAAAPSAPQGGPSAGWGAAHPPAGGNGATPPPAARAPQGAGPWARAN